MGLNSAYDGAVLHCIGAVIINCFGLLLSLKSMVWLRSDNYNLSHTDDTVLHDLLYPDSIANKPTVMRRLAAKDALIT